MNLNVEKSIKVLRELRSNAAGCATPYWNELELILIALAPPEEPKGKGWTVTSAKKIEYDCPDCGCQSMCYDEPPLIWHTESCPQYNPKRNPQPLVLADKQAPPKEELWLDKKLREFKGDPEFEEEKAKLDELEPEFGVGDIVEFDRDEVYLISDKPNPHYGNKTTIGCVSEWGVSKAIVKTEKEMFSCEPKDLKLIFPASRIPKELDGIHCEPKGDIVELYEAKKGFATAGMVIKVNPMAIKPYLLLLWNEESEGFYEEHYHRNNIKRTIWRA